MIPRNRRNLSTNSPQQQMLTQQPSPMPADLLTSAIKPSLPPAELRELPRETGFFTAQEEGLITIPFRQLSASRGRISTTTYLPARRKPSPRASVRMLYPFLSLSCTTGMERQRLRRLF